MTQNKDFKNRKVILSLDNLKKYFVNHGLINKAVDGVTFDVHEGEIVGLIGESGSGKTTVGRTLLRLYEDFNGFVRLNDKIISGRRISHRTKKFMRRNIQMIFQDPHASLNGQQPIYSILKEPLLVNGIMKEKVNDIFKDWQKVKDAFKFTHNLKALELERNNLKEINTLAKPFFYEWVEKLKNLEFSKDIPLEDNFNSFFGYLEQKQNIESIIINNLYSNTDELLKIYYINQEKFRNNNLTKPEVDYLKAKEQLAKVKKLSKITQDGFRIKTKIKELKKELKEFKANVNEQVNSAKNAFYNYRKEFKSEQGLVNIARLTSIDLDYYLYCLKNEYLYKKSAQIMIGKSRSCKYLEFDQIKELISKISDYQKDFYKTQLEQIIFQPNVKNIVKETIKKNFTFDFSKYEELSNKNKQKILNQIDSLKDRIHENELLLAREKQKDPRFTQEQLAKAKEEFKLAEAEYATARIDILVDFKQKIKKLYEEINEQQSLYEELVSLQTECNKKYEELKDKFFVFMEELGKDKSQADMVKTYVTTYKSDLAIKEETLRSFDIERKYLNRDIKNLYILLGVDKNWVKKNLEISDNIKEDVDATRTQWKKTFNIFNWTLFKPLAKYLVTQLLYKITIYRALEDVGLLKQFAYRYPHEFSGGQLQRIVIARALITQPKVVVADEPIASLDISIQAQVVNLLKELCIQKNIGLIFIAHDLSMIEYVADNIQIMHLGKIVEFGKTEAIYAKPVHPYTINLFKAIPKISNANEKFQDVSFELDYLNEQQFPNIPEVSEVSKDHFIYGTKEQAKKWIKEAKTNESFADDSLLT